MNYKESKQILEEVKKAKKILINCHQSPDPDSFSSALSLRKVFLAMGKKVAVVCTSEAAIMKEVVFMEGYDRIQKVDFIKFDFSDYDLLVSPDSAEWHQVVGSDDLPKPKIKIVVIDHHDSNTHFGDINIVDTDKPSCAELVYLLFKDWGVKIGPDLANLLLVGLVGDTGAFQFPGGAESLKSASELVGLGADMDTIMFHLYRNKDYGTLKIIGEFLKTLEIDEEGKFAFMYLTNDIYKKYGKPPHISSYVANMFANVVKGTLFGFSAIERENNQTNVSFRARGYFDVSKIAKELGGGGHEISAATSVKGMSFDKALEKIIKVSRRHGKEYQKKHNKD